MVLRPSALFRSLNCAQRFRYRALGRSRRLLGAAEHLIDGSEKRLCRLSFEFKRPHVIESGDISPKTSHNSFR